jgi:hypothetical protein
MKMTNNTGIGLSMAVWLAEDLYDHDDNENTISVTALIKPLKKLLLGMRVDPTTATSDVSGNIATSMGTAIHNAIESAWVNNYASSLATLGFPKQLIDRIVINPDPTKLDPNDVPIYLEQRSSKVVGKYTVSGKFDIVLEGRVEDFKSTSAYSFVHKTNDEAYVLQGSIYRWLRPDIITQDVMAIQYIFTDWAKISALQNPKYPQAKVLEYKLNLLSIEETENYIVNKLNDIERLINAPESMLPACTPEDLWQKEPQYKYYKNPEKTTRSTKNFDSLQEANNQRLSDGNVGIVKTTPGKIVACRYCSGFEICKQKDAYIASGLLEL